jgi:hypothetical protein
VSRVTDPCGRARSSGSSPRAFGRTPPLPISKKVRLQLPNVRTFLGFFGSSLSECRDSYTRRARLPTGLPRAKVNAREGEENSSCLCPIEAVRHNRARMRAVFHPPARQPLAPQLPGLYTFLLTLKAIGRFCGVSSSTLCFSNFVRQVAACGSRAGPQRGQDLRPGSPGVEYGRDQMLACPGPGTGPFTGMVAGGSPVIGPYSIGRRVDRPRPRRLSTCLLRSESILRLQEYGTPKPDRKAAVVP